jgi:hypothetical protein
MSDRLSLAHAIEDAGIERSKAENVASVIVRVIEGNVATKADLDATKAELKADTQANTAESVREVESRLLLRLGAAVAVMLGLLFTALHVWPPR